jgi:hypothetical protein
MPTLGWQNLPRGVRDHLIDRLRERQITKEDMMKLQEWVATNPNVPEGEWYKDFGTFKLAGTGNLPKTFLMPGQVAKGVRID